MSPGQRTLLRHLVPDMLCSRTFGLLRSARGANDGVDGARGARGDHGARGDAL